VAAVEPAAPEPARPAKPRSTEPHTKKTTAVESADTGIVLRFMATLATWTLGWLAGGLLGALLFVEVWHHGALMSGQPLPGIATTAPIGSSGLSMIETVDAAGVLYWSLCGGVGGLLAAVTAWLFTRQQAVPSFTASVLAALVFAASIAILMSIALVALPLVGAANGALVAALSRRSGDDRGTIGLNAAAWLAGTVCGLVLVWLYQMA